MEAKAIQRYVRITPSKCNQVLDLIRGDTVEQATTTLQFTPKNGARIIQKVLKSAVANALHEGKVRVEDLYVKEAVVGAGPTLKRWLPRAQGRATPLLKRTSHVSVTVATRESSGEGA
ncbi:MAG TPA: 50S ribosomal protein L22 [Candidatus Eisenbacteria bacterium]|jgi:large subunit ribosomal protein L22